MSPSHIQPSREQFISKVEQEFSYLVNEFAFCREATAIGSHNLQVAYSSPRTRVVVEGTNWGLNTRVALGRSSPNTRFDNFDLDDLIELRGGTDESRPAEGTIEKGSTQLEQIPYYARVLKTIGTDILRGDFTVFPELQAKVDERARSST